MYYFWHSVKLQKITALWCYVNEWVRDRCFKSQLTILKSYRGWKNVYQAQWLGLWKRSCLYVMCMYWTSLVLVRPMASLYRASTLKHHVTGREWCPNPDHYPDSELASWSLTPLWWALSRAVEAQILTSFIWRGRGSNHQSPSCQANSQPLHYQAVVWCYVISDTLQLPAINLPWLHLQSSKITSKPLGLLCVLTIISSLFVNLKFPIVPNEIVICLRALVLIFICSLLLKRCSTE